jgi:hypothetical protein
MQAYPQSWRYTAITFNCVLLFGTVLFLASLATAHDTPAATPSPITEFDPLPPAPHDTIRDAVVASNVASRSQRRPRPGCLVARPAEPPHVLETVEECASSAECLSSADRRCSMEGIRASDMDDPDLP